MSNYSNNMEDISIDSCNTSEEESDILTSSTTSLGFGHESDHELGMDSKVYDCIVIGSGVSGLNCAHKLIHEHNISPNRLLIVEAQNYVGGRIRQDTTFIRGAKIELGAEILHGSDTLLTQYAKENKWPLEEIYCWAHGDGGPGEFPVNGGYGLYYFSEGNKLLRYDDESDEAFTYTNDTIWDFGKVDDSNMGNELTLDQFMRENAGVKEKRMLTMVAAGFSNTFCCNSDELCMKKCIEWCRIWDSESPTDQDYKFKESFSCLIDFLQANLPIRLNYPIVNVSYNTIESYSQGLANSSSNTLSDSISDNLVSDNIIEQNHSAPIVYLTAKDGSILSTRSVVVSCSLHVLKSGLISFTPALPETKLEAMNSCDLKKAMKIYVKFSKRCWPKGLAGMIMSGDDCVCPEVWFRDVSTDVAKYNRTVDEAIAKGDNHAVYEEATCYATGFATANYAERLLQLGEEGAVKQLLTQLQKIFALLDDSHMTAESSDDDERKSFERANSLPLPLEVYLGGFTYRYTPEANPYIGGGYHSPTIGGRSDYGAILASNLKNVFFCGEATSTRAGGTAHAALETGLRAAREVSSYLHSLSNATLSSNHIASKVGMKHSIEVSDIQLESGEILN